MGKSSLDSVVIQNDKVYTSYFSRAGKIVPNRRLISIARTSPEGWGGSYLRELNPSQTLLSAYKRGEISAVEYEKTFRFEVLDRLDRVDIYNKIKGKVLCCWEKSDSFCHRHLVLEWIKEGLGNEVIGGEI